MKLISALAGVLLVAASQASAQTTQWERISGARSKIKGEVVITAVVRTPDEWKQLWARHTGAADAAVPPVDFNKEMVVGVFLGERPKAGYAVECKPVELAAEAGDDTMSPKGPALVVFYKEVAPAKDGFGASVMTAPFELRKVKKYHDVSFEPDTLYRARKTADTLRVFKDQPRFDR